MGTWSRWLILTGSIVLAGVVSFAMGNGTTSAIPSDWVWHTVAGVEFAEPANFVPDDDAFPGVRIVGGGLLNAQKTEFALLLGVEVVQTPGATVTSESARLEASYRAYPCQEKWMPWGQELSFRFPSGATYDVILSPLPRGVREILINNVQSDPAYQPIIQTFLESVRNVIDPMPKW